jgi:hypothetical protein
MFVIIDGYKHAVSHSKEYEQMKKDLACHCGDTIFTLRLNVLEEVGVITCLHGHHSLLLDSRDYWGEVIQNGKPRELQCKCKSKTFTVALFYTFRTDSDDVSQVDIITKCTNCGTERRAMSVEIDYGPTNLLIDRPLDPCEYPWLRARQVRLSALWKQKDFELFISWVMGLDSVRAYLVSTDGARSTIHDESELRNRLRNTPLWDLYFFLDKTPFPEQSVVCWKDMPVIHVWGPQVMIDKTGASATMYFIEYAKEVIQGITVVPQPSNFLDFTTTITNWLRNTYTSERGKGTFDNPVEYARFRDWW